MMQIQDAINAMSKIWSVAEAKAQLSEVLRRARSEGPQRIGKRDSYVVITEKEWERIAHPRPPLGRWLAENMPAGAEIELPTRQETDRPIPFQDELNS